MLLLSSYFIFSPIFLYGLSIFNNVFILLSVVFIFVIVFGIQIYFDINYILSDWGKELQIDKNKRELILTREKEVIRLLFSDIDCVRRFSRGKTLVRWDYGWYYRIRLKEPKDEIILISSLVVNDLKKDLEGVTFYVTENSFPLIPNWKRPSKRPLVEKDPEYSI